MTDRHADGGGHDEMVLREVKESPDEKFVHVATGWGPVLIRRDQRRGHYWTKTVRFFSGEWYESRVYAEGREELLSHEHGVLPMEAYPDDN